jgi:hypothetical protein
MTEGHHTFDRATPCKVRTHHLEAPLLSVNDHMQRGFEADGNGEAIDPVNDQQREKKGVQGNRSKRKVRKAIFGKRKVCKAIVGKKDVRKAIVGKKGVCKAIVGKKMSARQSLTNRKKILEVIFGDTHATGRYSARVLMQFTSKGQSTTSVMM